MTICGKVYPLDRRELCLLPPDHMGTHAGDRYSWPQIDMRDEALSEPWIEKLRPVLLCEWADDSNSFEWFAVYDEAIGRGPSPAAALLDFAHVLVTGSNFYDPMLASGLHRRARAIRGGSRD